MTTTEYDETNTEKIRDLLMWKKVTKVSEDTLSLDDGTTLQIIPNEGCGGCSSGWYELTELNDCPDNAITNVGFSTEGEGYFNNTFSVFVLAADQRIKVWEVDGSDGNGYYGTGYRVRVAFPEGDK